MHISLPVGDDSEIDPPAALVQRIAVNHARETLRGLIRQIRMIDAGDPLVCRLYGTRQEAIRILILYWPLYAALVSIDAAERRRRATIVLQIHGVTLSRAFEENRRTHLGRIAAGMV